MPCREHLANAAIKLGAGRIVFKMNVVGAAEARLQSSRASMPPDLPDCNPATFHEIPTRYWGIAVMA